MKIQLDTTNKIIKVEESVNLNEFFEAVRRLFPDGEWKEFTIETNTTIVWNNPITINPYRPYNPWSYPYYPTITYDSSSTNSNYKLFNVEV